MVEIAGIGKQAAEQVRGERGIGDRANIQPVRGVERIVEILEVGDRPAPGDEIPIDHALAMQVEDAAFRSGRAAFRLRSAVSAGQNAIAIASAIRVGTGPFDQKTDGDPSCRGFGADAPCPHCCGEQ